MLSFDNTEIAFANQSDKRLRKTHFVFQLIAIPWLNTVGTNLLSIALKLRLPVKGLIRATVFDHFCGGENITECDQRIGELADYHVGTILDYSVEGKQDEADFERCFKNILLTIQKANEDDRIPFAVVKLTGLIPFDLLEKVSANSQLSQEEQAAFDRGKKRVQNLCQSAFDSDTPFLIDAEESWIQDAIDAIVLEMMQTYNQQKCLIYNTAQMYRHDRLAYIKELHQQAEKEQFHLGLKVVRGAYMEKERERAEKMGYPSPIQPDKAATDSDYDAAIAYCVDHHERIALCAGTHNEASSILLTKLMEEKSIAKNNTQIYFSQLLGMSDHISYNLSKANFNVAKYVPFGPVKDVMPYLIRRANENSSISGQTGRELSLILKEIKRRKGNK